MWIARSGFEHWKGHLPCSLRVEPPLRENIGLANDGIDAHPVHCKQPRETAREMSSSVGYGAVDWNDDYTVF